MWSPLTLGHRQVAFRRRPSPFTSRYQSPTMVVSCHAGFHLAILIAVRLP
jgi:hypothetical protein